MRSRPESVEAACVLGYLGRDDVLYCSTACARERWQHDATVVDQDAYQALLDRGALASGAVCPVCGSEYPLDWSAEGER